MQAMMFTLLQEQHQLQLEAMAAANKVGKEVMMERMNALVTAQGGRKDPAANKENTPPLTNGGKEDDRKKALCPHSRHSSTTSQKNATSWRRIKTRAGLGGSQSRRRRPDRDQGQQ